MLRVRKHRPNLRSGVSRVARKIYERDGKNSEIEKEETEREKESQRKTDRQTVMHLFSLSLSLVRPILNYSV